jgi:hypothetical protein
MFMKRTVTVIGLAGLLVAALSRGPAGAYSHSGSWGGSTSHSQGSTSHTNAYGGSSSHSYGEGSSHTNTYGGSTSHQYGGGSEHTNTYGGTTSGAYGQGATHTNTYGGTTSAAYGQGATHTNTYGATTTASGAYYGHTYPAYHPPTTVNYYGSGCYNCGGWSTAGAAAAGAAVGVAAGSAVASRNASAASSNAYSAGYAAGSANTAYAMGAIYPTVPAGCATPNVGGTTYYLCGDTWFQPFHGANGVYYRVVPTP